MASAVQTVCGQAYGAKKYRAMGIVCQRALILHLAAAFLISFLYAYAGSVLHAMQISTEIAAIAQVFARGLLPQLLAFALYCPLQRFLQAQNIVNRIAYISVVVFLPHVLLTLLAVYKLGCGVFWAALTLGLSWWVLTLATWVYILVSPSCKQTWSGLSKKAFTGLWPYLKLTIASAVLLCLEIWYNQVIVLISGLLPNAEIALDSIWICVNNLSWDMMVMLGLSNAVSTRLGNELGAAHPRVARFAVVVVVTTCVGISIVLSAMILLLRNPLSKLSARK